MVVPVSIRRLTSGDADEYAERYWELMKQLTDMDGVSHAMRSQYFSLSMYKNFWIFGAFYGSALVGITSVHFIAHLKGYAASIQDVVVDQEFRLRGICRELITHVEEKMPWFSDLPALQPFGIYKVVLESDPCDAGKMYEEKLRYFREEQVYRKNRWW